MHLENILQLLPSAFLVPVRWETPSWRRTRWLSTLGKAKGHSTSSSAFTRLDPAGPRSSKNEPVINSGHVREIDHLPAVPRPALINDIVFASQALFNMMNFSERNPIPWWRDLGRNEEPLPSQGEAAGFDEWCAVGRWPGARRRELDRLRLKAGVIASIWGHPMPNTSDAILHSDRLSVSTLVNEWKHMSTWMRHFEIEILCDFFFLIQSLVPLGITMWTSSEKI